MQINLSSEAFLKERDPFINRSFGTLFKRQRKKKLPCVIAVLNGKTPVYGPALLKRLKKKPADPKTGEEIKTIYWRVIRRDRSSFPFKITGAEPDKEVRLLTEACYPKRPDNAEKFYKLGCKGYLFWMRQAARLDHPKAQWELGIRYQEKNRKRAFRYFHKAAVAGMAEAQNNVGVAYANGEGVKRDMQKALHWFNEAANQENSEALCNLGMLFDEVEKNWKKAFEYFCRAAKKNNPLALCYLGICYKYAIGVKKDLPKAVECFRKSADLGEDEAMWELGNCYYNGDCVKKNSYTAFEWYQKAADLNNPRALHSLGVCFYCGRGAERDDSKAVDYFKRGAQLLEPNALYMLGICCRHGEGVEKNFEEAKTAFRMAIVCGDGHKRAEKELKKLLKKRKRTSL